MKNQKIKIYILMISLAIISCNTKQEIIAEEQQNDSYTTLQVSSTNEILDKVDQYPEFPGGMSSLVTFMQKNLKYPEDAKLNGVEGRVIVEFVILKDGTVDSAILKKGIGSGCDEAAIELIQSMPEWNPGVLNNELVNVKMLLPIVFKLN